NITFACENPVELSEFWEAALGYDRPEFPQQVLDEVQKAIDAGELDPTGWAMLVPPGGGGPRLLFQRRAKTPTESIPIHLDLGAAPPTSTPRASTRPSAAATARMPAAIPQTQRAPSAFVTMPAAIMPAPSVTAVELMSTVNARPRSASGAPRCTSSALQTTVAP